MKRYLLLSLVILLSIDLDESLAFWGGSTNGAASGLNVAEGFDVNTVATVNGTVANIPQRTEQQEYATMTLATPQGEVKLVLGPFWYWERQDISLAPNQEITATGSRAQGKDGVHYLFVQRLENCSTGKSIMLRSDSGTPLWSHRATVPHRMTAPNHNRPTGPGSHGSGMRGGRR